MSGPSLCLQEDRPERVGEPAGVAGPWTARRRRSCADRCSRWRSRTGVSAASCAPARSRPASSSAVGDHAERGAQVAVRALAQRAQLGVHEARALAERDQRARRGPSARRWRTRGAAGSPRRRRGDGVETLGRRCRAWRAGSRRRAARPCSGTRGRSSPRPRRPPSPRRGCSCARSRRATNSSSAAAQMRSRVAAAAARRDVASYLRLTGRSDIP